MHGLLTACITGIALMLFSSAHAQNYQPEYKLSTVLPNSYPWGKAGERWAELVKEKTNGRINIKMYPGTSLVGGDQTKEFSAIRQRVIDLAIGSTINWSPQVRQLNLFSLPFLMPDYKAMNLAIGQFTPPMAVNLMVTCRLANISIESTVPWVIWMVLAMTASMLLTTFVPDITLWLPRSLGYLN